MDSRIERATELALEQMARVAANGEERKIEFFQNFYEAGISYRISELLAAAHADSKPKTN